MFIIKFIYGVIRKKLKLLRNIQEKIMFPCEKVRIKTLISGADAEINLSHFLKDI